MNKKFGKILACSLAACSAMSFISCGKKMTVDNNVEDTTNLHIAALERGYGTEMISAWAERFEELNPGVTVEVKSIIDEGQFNLYFETKPELNDWDIFFGVTSSAASRDYSDVYAKYGYDHALMDYTEIYESNVYNEDVLFGDKINQSVKPKMQNVDQDGKYYAVPWAIAFQSIVVNEKVVKLALGDNYKLPNTTDELYAFAEDIRDAGYMPFTYPGQLDYWKGCFFAWWAQYEGVEAFENFYQGKVYDEMSDSYVYSANIFKQQGRLESLKVMEALLEYDNDNDGKRFHLGNVNDYNVNNFTALQKAFMNSYAATANTKKYAMMPNGDWLATESGRSMNDPIVMISPPVVSSIIEQCATIENDAELSALIDAIDSKNTALSGTGYEVSQADYDRIAEARNIIYSASDVHVAYSPVFANAKTLIKKFFAFMASDEGIEIYRQHVKPGIMPFNYNYSNSGDTFADSVMKLYDKYYVSRSGQSLLAVTSNVQPMFTNGGCYEALLGVSKSSKQHMSAQEIFESEFISEELFLTKLRNLGLVE